MGSTAGHGLHRVPFPMCYGIEISGIEFVRDASGAIFTYDVNTNTNYNPEAEAAASGPYGMKAIARFLRDELDRLRSAVPGIAAE